MLKEASKKLPKAYKDVVDITLEGYEGKRIYDEKGYTHQNFSKKMKRIISILRDDLHQEAINY